ncbi:MAG TPA: TonB C-terminal domain-containing protein [Sphingobium sp.]|nr:TonB C-terminal domain-containing protein [Sphingobium sp.]
MDRSERIGLGVATAGHVLLFGALSLGLLRTTAPLPPRPATIEVTLADSIALQSTTNQPVAENPLVATAPEQGPMEPDAAPPEPAEAPPAPVAPPTPPTPAPPAPAPPKPRAVEPAPPKPREAPPKTPPKASTKPAPAEKAPAKAKAEPTPKPAPARASRLGSDFLKGLDSDAPSPRNAPATAGSNAPMSPIAARALNAEITRQIKPFWRPPSGADAEKLVTLLSVHLDQNGAVVGRIEVIGQEGITASNRAQADLHAERAVQAVMRASPFRDLPPEYYDQWKWLRPLRIYASLGQ